MNEETYKAIEIANHFKYFFKTLAAVDDATQNKIYQLRHRVYCEELAYEQPSSNGREIDEFDSQSHFAAVQHKGSKELAGCVRLVKVDGKELLPLEKYCSFSLTHPELHPSKFDRDTICEISRVAILDTFRRRKEDQYDGAAVGIMNQYSFCRTERRCFPFIAISLYMAACAMAHIHGKPNAFIMVDPRLIKCTNLVGIDFEQIGNVVEYHGQRAPFYINYETFITGLKPTFIKMYLHIEKKIEAQFEKANLIANTPLLANA